MRVLALCLVGLVALAGCLQGDPAVPGTSTAGTPYPSEGVFDTSGPWSRTLTVGLHGRLPVEEVSMPSFDGTRIHMGIFRPAVPEGIKVPVIVDAGPYYGESDEPATSDQTRRLGGFLIENFVPHGYAVVQVSIRGTGLSTGCVDYLGEKEQRDLDAVVGFLGEQEWSTGAVGMIGRSYDGSTPWEAATFGDPALKTIVPISGISDLQQLHYRNGSAEPRSLTLGSLYYSYGATDAAGGAETEEEPTSAARVACAEGPQHAPLGAFGAATGGGRGVPGPTDTYWSAREFTPRVLENYRGSIFYVHGLQDWNVKPSQGVDVYNAFDGKKKALLGQWGHNYPDRPNEHGNLRWDWAEMLLRWFDSELKGLDTDTGPAVEIQDTRGNWRVEPTNAWPPADAKWLVLHPDAGGALVTEGAHGEAAVFSPAASREAPGLQPANLPPRILSFQSAPFAEETRISGQPRFHATVASSTPGGQVWAELWEKPAEGEAVRIGRAQMDLRYADGGRTPTLIAPNTPVLALMEFYPLDAHLAAGSSLVLLVTGEAGETLANPLTAQLTFTLGDKETTLEVPIIERPFAISRWDVADPTVRGESP